MLEHEISAAECAALRGGRGVVLLDVREPWEYRTARLENSLLMPLGDLPERAAAELDPGARILILCHHGVRSLNAALWLRENGFASAQSVRGGIDAWSREVDAAVPRY